MSQNHETLLVISEISKEWVNSSKLSPIKQIIARTIVAHSQRLANTENVDLDEFNHLLLITCHICHIINSHKQDEPCPIYLCNNLEQATKA